MTPEEALNLALSYHRSGKLAESEKLYRQILAQQPANDRAMNMLGVLAMQSGRPDAAIEILAKAVALKPREAEYHLNHGAALDKVGRLDEAVTAYRQALSLRADYAQALSNLGNALRRQGHLEEAIALGRRALAVSPDFAEGHHNLGVTLLAAGQHHQAIEAMSEAAARQPNSIEFLYALARALAAAGRAEDAVVAYRKVISKKPVFAEAWTGLGEALRKAGSLNDAVAAGEQAVTLRPNWAEAHDSLGKSFYEQNRMEKAAACHRAALALKDSAGTRINLGAAMQAHRYWDGAITEYRRALMLDPRCAEAHNNLGSALKHKGLFVEAAAEFSRAIELRPEYAGAHWNLGLMLLAAGDFERGWQEYEWRWKAEELKPPRVPSVRPRWNGEELNGKRILLYSEQGLGDAIQFVRYVPRVISRGGKIVLAAQAELQRLLQTTWPPSSEIGGQIEQWVTLDQPAPPHDVQWPLMSLPMVFGTRLDNIPSVTPYLSAISSLSAAWKARLPADGRRKVGLVWAGRPTYRRDLERSIALEAFAPLAELEGISLVSLQKGEAARMAKPVNFPIADWTSELRDMADTAALIENLDLVISVDTAVAHLAAALGKPVWVLLPATPDWRWMRDRADSPWYPTMRLFRLETGGDWKLPIAQVMEALRAL